MMEATSARSGNAFLMRPMRGTHQSTGLSEISSQFQEECSAVPGRFFMDIVGESTSERRNFVLGPRTLTTGCRPIVLVTTPPQPASKARTMLDSDSVGGAEESRNGLRNRIPVKSTDRSTLMGPPGVFRETRILRSLRGPGDRPAQIASKSNFQRNLPPDSWAG